MRLPRGAARNYVLGERWGSIEEILAATRADGLRLDLGCGYSKPPGYIGLDNLVGEGAQIKNEANAPDILMDLNREPLPFPDESCEEVRSSHFLEHSILDHVIDESHRVLRPGGSFRFAVPYANSAEGMFPGHTIFLTEKWFHENLNFQAKFEIVSEDYLPSDDWLELPRTLRRLVPFGFARKHLFNVCREMTVVARPRK
jgi:SAM-dependent methyltransferase